MMNTKPFPPQRDPVLVWSWISPPVCALMAHTLLALGRTRSVLMFCRIFNAGDWLSETEQAFCRPGLSVQMHAWILPTILGSFCCAASDTVHDDSFKREGRLETSSSAASLVSSMAVSLASHLEPGGAILALCICREFFFWYFESPKNKLQGARMTLSGFALLLNVNIITVSNDCNGTLAGL